MTKQIPIPQEILDAAKVDLHAPQIVAFMDEIKQRFGVAPGTSPADYPSAVWDVCQALTAANNPGATGGISGVESSILGLMLTETEKAEMKDAGDSEQVSRATEILDQRFRTE